SAFALSIREFYTAVGFFGIAYLIGVYCKFSKFSLNWNEISCRFREPHFLLTYWTYFEVILQFLRVLKSFPTDRFLFACVAVYFVRTSSLLLCILRISCS